MFRRSLSFIKRRVFRIDRYTGFILHDLLKDPFKDQGFILADKDVSTIFDVGAYIGQTAIKYHKEFPTAQIYCFEPFPDAFARLSAATATIPEIKRKCVALSEHVGETKMYVSKSHAANSLLRPVDCQEQDIPIHSTPVTVKVTTLDTFCQENNIGQIDILKLDVQGSELIVLNGGIGKIESEQIGLIYSEVMFVRQYRDQPRFCEIYEFLINRGYVLFGLYEMVYDQIGMLHWADAIFISKSIYTSLFKRERSLPFHLWSRDSFVNNW